MKQQLVRLLAGTILLLAVVCAPASAAAVTVNLRVEGPTSTFFEGNVSVDATTIDGHPCNVAGNGDPAPGGTPQPTPTGALIAAGQSVVAPWDATYKDAFVTAVNGIVNTGAPAYQPYWNLAINGISPDVGGCQVALHNGDRVVWGYANFGDMVLSLTGPVSANVGETVPFVVRNAANNVGQAGASVAGATSDANGVANAVFGGVGTYTVKAEKPGTVRSNGVTICIHNGNDGNCGFPLDPSVPPPSVAAPVDLPAPPVAPVAPSAADTTAPVATIAGLRNRQRFAKRKGPRSLKGVVADSSSLKSVDVRLRRKSGRKCRAFDGKAERFRVIKCSAQATWFSVGTKADWSYLLPARLPKGLYQLQVRATDVAGNQSTVQSLRFRVA